MQEAVNIVGPDVGGVYITKAQSAYRALNRENPFDRGASDAYRFVSLFDTLDKKTKNGSYDLIAGCDIPRN